MTAAMACMYVCEQPTMASTDIGDALTCVKEVLRLSGDGSELIDVAIHRVTPISMAQLRAWRQHTRQLVVSEHRHVQVRAVSYHLAIACHTPFGHTSHHMPLPHACSRHSRVQATRRLHKLARSTGFSMHELK